MGVRISLRALSNLHPPCTPADGFRPWRCERRPEGSTPSRGTNARNIVVRKITRFRSSMDELFASNEEDGGSSPSGSTLCRSVIREAPAEANRRTLPRRASQCRRGSYKPVQLGATPRLRTLWGMGGPYPEGNDGCGSRVGHSGRRRVVDLTPLPRGPLISSAEPPETRGPKLRSGVTVHSERSPSRFPAPSSIGK